MRNSPRTASIVARRRLLAIAWLTALFISFLAVSADAQVATRRRDAELEEGPTKTFLGGALTYAQPQGDFKNYVNGAIGAVGHLVQALDDRGIVALRFDAGVLIYGQTTNRQPLGGGALGLVNVDVTTSNNIVFGGAGLQLMAPTGAVRPYVSATVGGSYFFTESSVEGTNDETPFANSQNFDDGGFTTLVGGGLYIPFRSGSKPVSLDLGLQMHRNNDVQYLTKNSISIANTSSAPVITPVRSAADFITFRLGVSVGVR